MSHISTEQFNALNIAVLTVSDTRTKETDCSGRYLADVLQQVGHYLKDKQIIIDDLYQIRAIVSIWIAEPKIDVILITGGTGFTSRDITPEAVSPLFDKQIKGFGELFRYLSYQELGSTTIHSRALAGFANKTVIFCLPGSTGACKSAWENIIAEQLNSQHQPCNFAAHIREGSL